MLGSSIMNLRTPLHMPTMSCMRNFGPEEGRGRGQMKRWHLAILIDLATNFVALGIFMCVRNSSMEREGIIPAIHRYVEELVNSKGWILL
jgi:hypothetical protein